MFYVWFDALTAYLSAVGGPRLRKGAGLAGGFASGGERHHPVSRCLLAGVSDGGDVAAAEASLGARVAPDGQREDEQVQGKCSAAAADCQHAGHGRPALFPAARNGVWAGRKF